MNSKLIAAGLFAASLAGTAMANTIPIVVTCPNGNSVAGIRICATPDFACNNCGPFCGVTDENGLASIDVPSADHYNFCVDVSTLPKDTTVSGCQDVLTMDPGPNPPLEFTLDGGICATPNVGPCWETGGGTLDKVKGDNVWTFGGVIYPGCSSFAAGGGNLNIVNHVNGLHFKGENIVVDDCRGVATKSPKVSVNIIDWHGTGEVTLAGATIPVTFMGTFMDAHDGGAGSDGLYIQVLDGGGNLVFQIGGGPDNLDLLTTGNVQIHQSSCGKGKP
jgi:hypothetical protein